MKILTTDCFEILKIINKMGIKKEIVKLIKEFLKTNMKVRKLQANLLKIAEKKFKGDIEKAVENNLVLAEEYDNALSDQSGLGMEGIFLIVESMPLAQNETIKLIAKLNGTTTEEVEGYEADVLIEKIKEIIMCESFQRFFSSMMK